MILKEPYDNAGARNYEKFRLADPDVVDFLLRFIRKSNFLDAGCGTGNNLVAIHERTGWKGYGCDVSPHMLAIAQERNCAQELKLADLDSEFPFAQEFEVVYAMDVVHHLKKPEVFFENSFGNLQPGGYLLIGTESEEDLRGKLTSKYFPHALEIDLSRYHSIEKLRRISLNAGFEDIEVEQIRGKTEVINEYVEQCQNKAHSILAVLDEESFQSGLQRLNTEFLSGQLKSRDVRYTFLTISKYQ